MNINKNSWHYKLWKQSFSLSDRCIPNETDLCRYCHRVFWQMMFIATMIACVIILVVAGGSLLMLLGQAFWLNTGLGLKILSVAVLVITIIALYIRWIRGSRKPIKDQGLVKNWVRASKEGVCPLVTFHENKHH